MPFVLLCAFLCTSAGVVRGASLFGKVIEVNSGDVITIFNLNRPVRVRLLGVDAPEMDQAFGDVAKKHLADLVYDKSVLVEYAGISGDHSLNGRVLLEGADIGAQMIRDGAAWVDPSNQHRLSAMDREVYIQSEEAARSERRGLWQQENPVAPWEFVKALALRRNPVATLNTVAPDRKPAPPDRPTPELTNLTLMAARVAAAKPPGKVLHSSDVEDIVSATERNNWRLLRPEREHFSALVPTIGQFDKLQVSGAEGYLYRGGDGWSAFAVVWLVGSTYGESDNEAMKNTLGRFLKKFGQGYEADRKIGKHPDYSCELQNEKDISMGGFTGLEFELSHCTIPAKARVFTRIVDDYRQMYFATAFYFEPDPNVDRFINAFAITQPKATKSTKGTK